MPQFCLLLFWRVSALVFVLFHTRSFCTLSKFLVFVLLTTPFILSFPDWSKLFQTDFLHVDDNTETEPCLFRMSDTFYKKKTTILLFLISISSCFFRFFRDFLHILFFLVYFPRKYMKQYVGRITVFALMNKIKSKNYQQHLI